MVLAHLAQEEPVAYLVELSPVIVVAYRAHKLLRAPVGRLLPGKLGIAPHHETKLQEWDMLVKLYRNSYSAQYCTVEFYDS